MERVIAGSANHTYTLHRNNWPLMVHTRGGAQRQGGWKIAYSSEFLSTCLQFHHILSIIRRKKTENGGQAGRSHGLTPASAKGRSRFPAACPGGDGAGLLADQTPQAGSASVTAQRDLVSLSPTFTHTCGHPQKHRYAET